jgi:predicted TIM-barrel fold metal-dependent hydrolase
MPTIDSQVHCYERDQPGRPWLGTLAGPPSATGDEMVAAMDAVGVDGALLVSPFSLYGFDASYALAVHAAHPGRFGLIKPVNPNDPDVERTIAEWAAIDAAVGIRILMYRDVSRDEADPGLNRILAAGARHALPVNVLCWRRLEQVGRLAARNPDTAIVIDHVGLQQTFEPPPPEQPFADLDVLLTLAAHRNVSVKISGACTLSRAPFPYRDIWPHLARIFDAFGIERCMWGTDWTRAVAFLTYAQGVDAFRVMEGLSSSERVALMGGSLQAIYGWTPSRAR